MSWQSSPIFDITKETGKALQQVIPLLRDLESLFAGLSTDIPGITEEDKIDIRIMPRAIHIMTSQFRVLADVYTSQTSSVEQSNSWEQFPTMIVTITSDAYQVLSDTKRLLSSKELQPIDYTQAVNNMIGAIYAVYLVEQKYKKPTSSTAIINTSTKDVIALFPDFNKRLHDIGIERH